jgi:hypothetical protein
LGKLLTLAFAPVTTVWALAESRIWLSIGVLVVLAAVAALLGRPAVAMSLVGLLSLLLMRAETVLAAQKAARAA